MLIIIKHDFMRITPACAGSRRILDDIAELNKDHPRVRGEQYIVFTLFVAYLGSPPRARGAVVLTRARRHAAGITPACAGSRVWW